MRAFRKGWLRLLAVAVACWLVPRTAGAGAKYAFLVGVKEYDARELKSLAFPENDIGRFAAVLGKVGYAADNMVVMTQGRGAKKLRMLPTSDRIRRELRLVLREVTAADTLLVAMAGHGVQFRGEKDSYFCPADARLSDRKTLISFNEIYAALKACKAGTKVLFVDACRNDPRTRLSRSRETLDLESVTRPQRQTPPGGITALFSCSAGQESFEHPELKQGVFFHFVVEAFSGKADFDRDGELSLAEIELYTGKQVQRFVRTRLGVRQVPERRGEGRGLMVLASLSRSKPLIPNRPSMRPGSTITNSIGMKLVSIPAGDFMMGSHQSSAAVARITDTKAKYYEGEHPLHRVRISKSFHMGVYEVTQEEYERVMGTNPSDFSRGGSEKDRVAGLDTKRFPVETVSWADAVAFCGKLSALPAERSANRVYRLPTEAEWEYACRAGTKTAFHFGATLDSNQANFDGNSPYGTAPKGPRLDRPTRVGSYKANAFGLYDMHGNVWEWCSDWHLMDYYSQATLIDPKGPSSLVSHAIRGGGWYDDGGDCRCACRGGCRPEVRGDYGFRVVCQSRR